MARNPSRILALALLWPLALALLWALAVATGRAQDDDPVYNGKKASAWVDVLVNDASARQRALAIDALAKLWADKQYKEAIPSIGRSLRLDSSAAVRTAAALALGSMKEEDIVKKGLGAKDLIDAMGTEKESRVRKEIARAIARFPVLAKAAVIPLTGALKDPDPATRAAVADALALTAAEGKSAAVGLAPLLADEDKGVRYSVVIALGRISPEGAPAIAETMAKMLGTEKDLDMKVELITSLGLLGEKSPAVVNALAAVLTNPEDDIRLRAVHTLGTFGTGAEPAAGALLKAAETDKVKDVRVDAVRAFGSALGPSLKGRVADLVRILEKDSEYEVRLAAVEEIGALGNDLKDDAETMKALRKRLSDPHVKVREAVAAAIRKIEKKPEPKKEPDKKDEYAIVIMTQVPNARWVGREKRNAVRYRFQFRITSMVPSRPARKVSPTQ
jgi:HEAT repeat protein